ncbi:MAG: hypothetical protein RBS22_02435 [Spongiibacteraceae bacterium]|jgi:hypothetical protein|nr:hypothetical protein [Spongiibacteraceae bacterium]
MTNGARFFQYFLRRSLMGTALASVLLAGCGGSGGAGGGSQDPDPVVVDIPIAYVKRPLPTDTNGMRVDDDALAPISFNPGARLYLRERAAASAQETDISSAAFGADAQYDVKDVSPSYDGSQLLFAMRAPQIPGLDDDEQPTWNIWEYDLQSGILRRVIASDIAAEEGQDIAPRYLPDGRIVFSSTRQRTSRAILLDEGKPQFTAETEDRRQYSFQLHRMNSDGSNIEQLTFNQSHDLAPVVHPDGHVLFTRWDNIAGRNRASLYRIRPDGRGLTLMYGYHSQDSGTNGAAVGFFKPGINPAGEVLVQLRPRVSASLGADIVRVNLRDFIDRSQPTWANTGMPGEGQRSVALEPVHTDASPSPHGHFSDVWPLHDGTQRMIASWTQCRLQNSSGTIIPCTPANLAIPGIREAPPLYGLWMYNLRETTQQPIIQPREGLMYTDIVAAEPQTRPAVLADGRGGVDLDQSRIDRGVGVLHIRSVYDFDGADTSPAGIGVLADPMQTSADQRPARFLRIVKAVSMPDDEVRDFRNTAFGRSPAQLMREIIGYAPVQPDGSVKLEVPANIPFAIAVLDAQGRRLGERHQNWLQLRPGEVLECAGCHSAASTLPHGRLDAQAPSINSGATTTGAPFPNTSPALSPDMGETMAETYTRFNDVPVPALDVLFEDVWTDTNLRPADPPLAYRYVDLATPAPVSPACQAAWTANCRITIHYPTHIQPLWDLDRRVFDTDGVTVLADNTCTSCHSTQDAMGALQVPAAQLDLRNVVSNEQVDHLMGYRELLFNDNAQELTMGALLDSQVQATDAMGNPLFQLDADGNPLLDGMGNPIPVMIPVTVTPAMSAAGARASSRFFNRFAAGASHAGRLQPSELRLIAEWLDIGAQYWNNPFDAPAD